jgi:hypothetical protein
LPPEAGAAADLARQALGRGGGWPVPRLDDGRGDDEAQLALELATEIVRLEHEGEE